MTKPFPIRVLGFIHISDDATVMLSPWDGICHFGRPTMLLMEDDLPRYAL